mmetsp:Transcript_20382/g.51482  ORF Transcript_20382/g.51482 Transcript_20382/m.51482 type:complete len:392 (-) Transcript_20382:406-1581(-)
MPHPGPSSDHLWSNVLSAVGGESTCFGPRQQKSGKSTAFVSTSSRTTASKDHTCSAPHSTHPPGLPAFPPWDLATNTSSSSTSSSFVDAASVNRQTQEAHRHYNWLDPLIKIDSTSKGRGPILGRSSSPSHGCSLNRGNVKTGATCFLGVLKGIKRIREARDPRRLELREICGFVRRLLKSDTDTSGHALFPPPEGKDAPRGPSPLDEAKTRKRLRRLLGPEEELDKMESEEFPELAKMLETDKEVIKELRGQLDLARGISRDPIGSGFTTVKGAVIRHNSGWAQRTAWGRAKREPEYKWLEEDRIVACCGKNPGKRDSHVPELWKDFRYPWATLSSSMKTNVMAWHESVASCNKRLLEDFIPEATAKQCPRPVLAGGTEQVGCEPTFWRR